MPSGEMKNTKMDHLCIPRWPFVLFQSLARSLIAKDSIMALSFDGMRTRRKPISRSTKSVSKEASTVFGDPRSLTIGVRDKYARRYAKGSNVVVLEPDVAKVFPNAEAVNGSLRSLAEIIRRRKSAVAK